MDAQTFQAALQATARIACCAVFISCQKQTTPTPEPPPMQEHAQQEQENKNLQPPPSIEPATDYSAAYLACTTKIKEADQKSIESNTPPSQVNPEILDCCNLQIDELAKLDKNPFEWENRNFCCDALEWQGSMACTPWGPPTPPALA